MLYFTKLTLNFIFSFQNMLFLGLLSAHLIKPTIGRTPKGKKPFNDIDRLTLHIFS